MSVSEASVEDEEEVSALVERAREAFADGQPVRAKEPAERLQALDCSVCQRMGVVIGGLALAGDASFEPATEGTLCAIGEQQAESFLDASVGT